MFRSRRHAGALLGSRLAQALVDFKEQARNSVIVVALPRGGAPVALEIASAIGCPMDILGAKKIGAPGQPEFAIGAVTADGLIVLNQEIANYMQVPPGYFYEAKQQLASKTRAQEDYLRRAAGLTEPLAIQGKLVILVDDGIATGMTAIAAIRSLKARNAAQIITAAPVMASSAVRLIEKECEHIATLLVPKEFAAVGQFYADFSQVEDSQVIACLRQNQMSLATA